MNTLYPELPPRTSADPAAGGPDEPRDEAMLSRPDETASRPADTVNPAPIAASDLLPHEVGAEPAPGTPPRSLLGWADLLYIVLFYVVSGVVLTLIVTGLAMIVFHIPFASLQKSVGTQASVLIVAQGLLSAATMAFIYLLVRGRTAAPFWPAVGWRAFRNVASRGQIAARYILGGFGLAVTVGILGRYVNTKSSPVPLEEMFRSRLSVLLLMALGILVAPIVEETIFRGCVYPVIAGRFGAVVGVVATGMIFGLAHAQQLGWVWGQVALLVMVGIILTYIRARAGTVAASYFVHLGYNTTLFTLFYLATGGLRNLPGPR